MPTLDLYKNRRFSTIKLGTHSSGIKEFKIPNEYTVEEVERLLELHIIQEKIEAEEVVEATKEAQIKRHADVVFSQLEIIFQHYQPEITAEDLKKLVSNNEALEMIGFFDKYRITALRKETQQEDSKKKADLLK